MKKKTFKQKLMNFMYSITYREVLVVAIVLFMVFVTWKMIVLVNKLDNYESKQTVLVQPTITMMVTKQVQVWYTFPVTILDRGFLPNGLPRTVTLRSEPEINGADVGSLRPNTEWTCDIAIPEGQNVWCKLGGQYKYFALKYNGVYFTDWRE